MDPVQRLRKAARELAEADDDDLYEAVKHFNQVQVDWYNAIPRDDRMVPLSVRIPDPHIPDHEEADTQIALRSGKRISYTAGRYVDDPTTKLRL